MIARTAVCIAALAALGVQAQTLYKCVQPNGRILYQQEPCPDTTKQSTVRPPDAPASKTAEEVRAAGDKAAQEAELQMNQVIQVMADVTLCQSDAPGFDAKHAAAVQAWKSRNGKMVEKFDQDQDARSKAIARVESERARHAANKAALAARCDQVAASLGAGPTPAAAKK